MLRNKDEALEAFEDYKSKAENKYNKRIKEFFTDNGGEYINKRFKILAAKYGIEHHTTPPYTKEPNGLIERLNLTIINKVRSLLYTAKLPVYLWGEAIKYAVHLYNITPHRGLDYKSPYEVINKKKPYINNLKIWGSLVYFQDNKGKTKLEPRNKKGILLNTIPESQIYRVWDIDNKKPLLVRDIRIIEGEYIQPSDDNHKLSQENDLYIQPQIDPIPEQEPEQVPEEQNQVQNHRQESPPILDEIVVQGNPEDYIYSVQDTLLNVIASILGNKNNSPTIKYCLTAANNGEPTSIRDILNSPNRDNWIQAMLDEDNSFHEQGSYIIVDLPPNCTALGGKWVFKEKFINNPDIIKPSWIVNEAENIRYKACWVI